MPSAKAVTVWVRSHSAATATASHQFRTRALIFALLMQVCNQGSEKMKTLTGVMVKMARNWLLRGGVVSKRSGAAGISRQPLGNRFCSCPACRLGNGTVFHARADRGYVPASPGSLSPTRTRLHRRRREASAYINHYITVPWQAQYPRRRFDTLCRLLLLPEEASDEVGGTLRRLAGLCI